MSKSHSVLLVVALSALLLLGQSVFIVKETHQALVLQFGDPVEQHTAPGLKFKIPFIQQITEFDKRVLDLDPPPEEVILADQKRLVVDTFARYRINNMLEFYKSLSTEAQANTRLNNIVNSTLRSVLGNSTLADLLSEKRAGLMGTLRQQVNESVKRFGIEIVDIRIGRADLPEQTSQAIYSRMRTERQREAAEFRAQGQEQAQEIRSKADKERTVLLAEAEQQSQLSRGKGDEGAIKIYAEAFKKDPEFYAFYRTMEAYRDSLPGENTTLVLSPDNDFLSYFKDQSGKR
ncbi:MAG: protease modulator HflC [Alphaproteobacteria bacterium]|nr:protease modulator HflC [Alphaproteobacteria bacterium]